MRVCAFTFALDLLLQISDIADAAILSQLFDGMWEQGCCVIATSNRQATCPTDRGCTQVCLYMQSWAYHTAYERHRRGRVDTHRHSHMRARTYPKRTQHTRVQEPRGAVQGRAQSARVPAEVRCRCGPLTASSREQGSDARTHACATCPPHSRNILAPWTAVCVCMCDT